MKKILFFMLFLFSCQTNTAPRCILVKRIENGDSLTLIYSCGSKEEKVCRIVGNKEKKCKIW
jgi:hypothetical protein